MIAHITLGADATARRQKVRTLIAKRQIRFGGHKKLKIYGLLSCTSGKQMKVENRVFFETEAAAITAGYRPCGHCMPAAYQSWKAGRE